VLADEGPSLIGLFPGVTLRMTKLDYDPTEPICATTYIRCLESGELRLKAKELSLGQYGSVVTVVSVACTSMSYLLGHLVIRRELTTGFPLARVTDMAEAQVEALKALGATRIALLTPYIEDVSIANALHLTAGAGVDVVVRYTLQLPTDALTTGITPDTIANLAVQITCPTIDVVVIGCSAFRACGPGFISELERRLGKPVITSTQAYLWWMLRVAGVMDRVVGYGRLFTHH
jgi:maleate isomerase